MRVIFMGTPAFVVPVLDSLTDVPGVEIVGVYAPPDRPQGRGRNLEMSPVKEFAVERSLPVFQPTSLRREEAQNQLVALSPDVIVVAAYGKILPDVVLEAPKRGCLNLHPL